MRKQAITNKNIILIPLLLMSLAFIFTVSTADVSAADMFVNGSDGNDANDGLSWASAKHTIGNATGTVTENGIVTIAEGVYSGENNTQIIIDKNMTIQGLSQTGTIINGTGSDWIFHINNGISVTLAKLTLTNATRGDGGAIYNTGTLIVTNCTFTDNIAHSGMGGAIFSTGDLTALGSTFINNYADSEGGAIDCSGTMIITDCKFISNKAPGSGTCGGAIGNNGGNNVLTVIDSEFSDNIACYYGGAIYYNGEYLTVTGSNFNENNAGIYGGAIYYSGELFTLTSSEFSDNIAGQRGGAIYSSGNLIVSDCNFTKNNATSHSGGAIYNDAYNLTVINSNFVNNHANQLGGAIDTSAGSPDETTNIIGGSFTGNHGSDGGAIYTNEGTLTISGTSFTSNNVPQTGGAIYNSGAIVTVLKSNFTQNTAFSAGAIFNSINGVLTVTESNFTRNIASYEAGAIMNAGYQNIGIATIIGNNFIGNTANLWAGAISNYGNLTANFNRIINNTAPTATDIHGDEDRGFIDALYNWWGSNSGPGLNSLVNVDLFNPWLVLTFTANPTTIPQGATSTLMADFRYDSENGFHDPSLGHLPDDTPVTFSTTLGNVGSKTVDKQTLNAIATAILRADEAAGEAIAGVLVDFQPLTHLVTITPFVNAASTTATTGKTVGMQTTGVPIAPLAIGILSVLGGLRALRKKQ